MTLLKKDLIVGVFLLILQKLIQQFLYRILNGNCLAVSVIKSFGGIFSMLGAGNDSNFVPRNSHWKVFFKNIALKNLEKK